jgi:hypothetical protein
MLGDASVACAWPAELGADGGDGDDVALRAFQGGYRGAIGSPIWGRET